MKIENLLNRFLNAGGPVAESTQSPPASQVQAQDSDAEAVKLAPGFGQSSAKVQAENSAQSNSTEQQSEASSARVATIKAQVDAGTYSPDPTKVAESVADKLFF